MAVKFFSQSNHAVQIAHERLREVEHIVKHNRHQNIIRFFGYVTENIGNQRMITGYAMEHMTDRSLHSVIHNPAISFGFQDIASWGRQASLALAWLHSRGDIHRDVKPDNMLLSDGRKVLKLCDFGTARETLMDASMTLGVGTLTYMAPELLVAENRGRYSDRCDVYSMGIVMWEMNARKFPFGDSNMGSLTLMSHVSQGGRPPLDIVPTPEFRDVIRICTAAEPAERPSMKNLEEQLDNLGTTWKAMAAAVQDDCSEIPADPFVVPPPPEVQHLGGNETAEPKEESEEYSDEKNDEEEESEEESEEEEQHQHHEEVLVHPLEQLSIDTSFQCQHPHIPGNCGYDALNRKRYYVNNLKLKEEVSNTAHNTFLTDMPNGRMMVVKMFHNQCVRQNRECTEERETYRKVFKLLFTKFSKNQITT